MQSVTITDSSQNCRFLAFDLVDILRLLPEAVDSEWEISAVECTGVAAEKLQRLADSQARVPGQILLELAADLIQIIDGEFIGYHKGDEQPWIIIRAVDSTAFDVASEDESVLARMKQHFKNVVDMPCLTQGLTIQKKEVTL
jgi:hypothetical protein